MNHTVAMNKKQSRMKGLFQVGQQGKLLCLRLLYSPPSACWAGMTQRRGSAGLVHQSAYAQIPHAAWASSRRGGWGPGGSALRTRFTGDQGRAVRLLLVIGKSLRPGQIQGEGNQATSSWESGKSTLQRTCRMGEDVTIFGKCSLPHVMT